MARLNLWLAMGGYLLSDDGRFRHVPGLEEIAKDAHLCGLAIEWGDLPEGQPAYSHWWSGTVVLATWLFDREGWLIRSVFTHELAHCVTGRSCERARAWQGRHYGDLMPAWVT